MLAGVNCLHIIVICQAVYFAQYGKLIPDSPLARGQTACDAKPKPLSLSRRPNDFSRVVAQNGIDRSPTHASLPPVESSEHTVSHILITTGDDTQYPTTEPHKSNRHRHQAVQLITDI